MQRQSEQLSAQEIVSNAYEYKIPTDSLSPLKNSIEENKTSKQNQRISQSHLYPKSQSVQDFL